MYSILIIEDDETSRFYMEFFLKKEGFDVRCAIDGHSGLDLLYKERPDLVLCDIMMPDMDGHTVLEAVRKERAFADIPFIFVTALTDRAAVRQGMNEGADDYLPKPFSTDELLAAVSSRICRYEVIRSQQNTSAFQEERAILLTRTSRREREILLLVGNGGTSKEIARQLFVSLKTVERHRENIMKKLSATNAATLARWAIIAELAARDLN
ncbi:MAG TPA: response regulator transcription factor [Desulfuromonadales bacterium]|nr:response regulator transcription factor [Desulfuromonadales bacterium]